MFMTQGLGAKEMLPYLFVIFPVSFWSDMQLVIHFFLPISLLGKGNVYLSNVYSIILYMIIHDVIWIDSC